MSKTTTFMNWIGDKILQRITSLFTGWIGARTEAHLLDAHVEMLSQLEDKARQLEADGKQHLADQLRRGSQRISAEIPGTTALDIVSHLSQPDVIASLPFMEDVAIERPKLTSDSSSSGNHSKRRRGRPKKRNTKSPTSDA